MNIYYRFLTWFNCFRWGHVDLWIRNIHGDEIIGKNGMRSEWHCVRCFRIKYKPELYYKEIPGDLDNDLNE